MNKWDQWYNDLPEQTKIWLKNQPLWKDSDLTKAGLIGIAVGFILGLIVGYEWAVRPVVTVFRPLVG